jgi:hypothetical protein
MKADINDTLRTEGREGVRARHDRADKFKGNGGDQSTHPLILSKCDFLKGFEPPDYLIDGILQRRFVYSLTGQTGHAKTAVALLIAQLVSSVSETALAHHRVDPQIRKRLLTDTRPSPQSQGGDPAVMLPVHRRGEDEAARITEGELFRRVWNRRAQRVGSQRLTARIVADIVKAGAPGARSGNFRRAFAALGPRGGTA